MISTDMLLTTIILIGCMSVLAESTAVQCQPGDKQITIVVEAEFREEPLQSSYAKTIRASSNFAFDSSYNEYSRSQANYDSSDTSGSASGSYGPFSASVSAAYSEVQQSASSMAQASGSTTSGSRSSSSHSEQLQTYFEGDKQILRDVTTTVTIDGRVASREETDIIRSTTEELTMSQLHQFAQEYIARKYSDQGGEITGDGTIFSQTKCYKTPLPQGTFSITGGTRHYLSRTLAVCDQLTAWGVYATGTDSFTIDLSVENRDHRMLHIRFYTDIDTPKIVLSSKDSGGWDPAIDTAIPDHAFLNGNSFRVDIKCLEDEFLIKLNGVELENRFPYRSGYTPDDVKSVIGYGGSNGMQWTNLYLP